MRKRPRPDQIASILRDFQADLGVGGPAARRGELERPSRRGEGHHRAQPRSGPDWVSWIGLIFRRVRSSSRSYPDVLAACSRLPDGPRTHPT